METIKYAVNRDVPVIASAEIIVLGLGPGGISAAAMAAKCGKSVIGIEKAGVPGGMAAVGEVCPFMRNHHNGQPMDRPVYTEWLDRMAAYQADGVMAEMTGRVGEAYGRLHINKEYAALSAEDMLDDLKVKTLYFHELVDAVTENGKITALILNSQSRLVAVKGKQFIDATGNGDLAAKVNCAYEYGNAEGFCQPMTLCFKLSNIHVPEMDGRFRHQAWHEELQKQYQEAKAAGKIDCPREDVLMFHFFDNDVIHFNTTRVIKHDVRDGLSYSEAIKIARRQLRQILHWLRTEIPGFEKAQIMSMASQIGVRESRRIKGLNYIDESAFIERKRFPDAICRCNYPIDIHNPSGSGTVLKFMDETEYYEIPFGCIVPLTVDNLLIGGRSISVSHEIFSSLRVMPSVTSLGQAAGAAAAMALDDKCPVQKLDGVKVRAALVKQGAFL